MRDQLVLHLRAGAARRTDDADLLNVAQRIEAGATLGIRIVKPDVGVVVHRGELVVAAAQRVACRTRAAVGQRLEIEARADAHAFAYGLHLRRRRLVERDVADAHEVRLAHAAAIFAPEVVTLVVNRRAALHVPSDAD